MCAGVCRMMMVVLAIVLVATGLMLLAGSLSPGQFEIGYHENEGQIYVVYVQDASHNLRLWLAGTGCFEPLPPWAYTDPWEGSPDYGRDFVRRVDRIEELVALFNC